MKRMIVITFELEAEDVEDGLSANEAFDRFESAVDRLLDEGEIQEDILGYVEMTTDAKHKIEVTSAVCCQQEIDESIGDVADSCAKMF